jgi:hypothetical protein
MPAPASPIGQYPHPQDGRQPAHRPSRCFSSPWAVSRVQGHHDSGGRSAALPRGCDPGVVTAVNEAQPFLLPQAYSDAGAAMRCPLRDKRVRTHRLGP